ncbi:MAG: ACT domain-containing protein, partial [Actinomycetota bacterium]|nr:ACT domain-containing protein [Actinomycetota bacterium]
DMEVLGPFVPLCEQLGRIGMALAQGSSVDCVEVELLGHLAERDTRLLSLAVLKGMLSGHTEEEVNLVNAPSLAEERGIDVAESKRTTARDFTDLVRVRVAAGDASVRVVGTTIGQRHRPHLLEAWGQRFNIQLEGHLTLLRYSDVPGMVGRVGTVLGERGINIASMAVGRRPEGADEGTAAMAITTDAPVPRAVLDEILRLDGFEDARSVDLAP